MKNREPATFRQDAYTNHCLALPDVLDRLQKQWLALYRIELAMAREDLEALRTAVGELNRDLVRYALTSLRKHLNEAAIKDCAALIAERIFDTAEGQPSLKRWEEWLSAAPLWPALAKENWGDALSLGTELVLSALEQEGVALDKKAKQALLADLAALQLRDLLPASLMSEVFPDDEDDPSGDGDA